jgi:hypothetical protein
MGLGPNGPGTLELSEIVVHIVWILYALIAFAIPFYMQLPPKF